MFSYLPASHHKLAHGMRPCVHGILSPKAMHNLNMHHFTSPCGERWTGSLP